MQQDASPEPAHNPEPPDSEADERFEHFEDAASSLITPAMVLKNLRRLLPVKKPKAGSLVDSNAANDEQASELRDLEAREVAVMSVFFVSINLFAKFSVVLPD